jgi:hypothetical protein
MNREYCGRGRPPSAWQLAASAFIMLSRSLAFRVLTTAWCITVLLLYPCDVMAAWPRVRDQLIGHGKAALLLPPVTYL